MGCIPDQNLMQRTGLLDKTEEEQGQDTHHSAQSLQASEAAEMISGSASVTTETPKNEERKKRVKWPKAVENKAWKAFEDETDIILEATLAGNINNKVKTMTTIIYTMGVERFGVEGKKSGNKHIIQNNRRLHHISIIRSELRRLTKAYKVAKEEERGALVELRDISRKKLISLRRAEYTRRSRKERMKKRAQFTSNPFQFMKRLLGDTRSGRLECPKEEVEQHLKETYSDPGRDNSLGECKQLIQPEEPTVSFDESEPRWEEVKEIIKKARAGSAPGPNGISYRVYKSCPKLARRLWKLSKLVWRKGVLAETWLISEGCFIPKEEGSKDLTQFRTISLLNVECKVFLAVLAKRITRYMLDNKYIDIAVQKGGIPGVSGCIEHTSVLTQIIREARENMGDLAVVWLDLANAYGSIPHKLVQETLVLYHIPDKVRKLLQHYFDNFSMRFTVGDYTTSWQRLEVGIVTGCTISVSLFAAAMNLLVKSAEKCSRGPTMNSGIQQPPGRAFMDDMTITSKSVVEARWTLEDLEKLITWARMKFKPAKSRSLVLKKGKVQDRCRFRIGGELIPTVTEKPVKYLGKLFTSALNDRQGVREFMTTAAEWLRAVDKSGLPGKFKAWCYQHGVLPKLLWPMLIYEIPTSTAEALERRISSYLRRWLGVPRSFSSIGLYSTGSKLQLPLKGLTEEYKATKVRAVLMLRDSIDKKISEAGIEVRTGRKWKASEAVAEAESRLKHQDIVGTVTQGRLGLGCIPKMRWKNASTKERRYLVQKEIKERVEEDRQTKAVAMKKQGSWLHWESSMSRKLTWNDIWMMESSRISFLLRSVYDVLPSPTNLYNWGLVDDATCKLCQKPANLEHVLSACKTALTDGRYTWRHDQVLKVIADGFDKSRRQVRPIRKKVEFINFQRAGGSGKTGKTVSQGLLSTASDWQLRADIHTQLQFPTNIAITNSRPDIVLWSEASKQVVIIELTVPWEDRLEEAHERKLSKYQQLVDDCRMNGWKSWCLPVEVGCRGFIGKSLWQALRLLGITGKSRKCIIGEVSREAEKASKWIWSKREENWRS
jgi:hypothetical protein